MESTLTQTQWRAFIFKFLGMGIDFCQMTLILQMQNQLTSISNSETDYVNIV